MLAGASIQFEEEMYPFPGCSLEAIYSHVSITCGFRNRFLFKMYYCGLFVRCGVLIFADNCDPYLLVLHEFIHKFLCYIEVNQRQANFTKVAFPPLVLTIHITKDSNSGFIVKHFV